MTDHKELAATLAEMTGGFEPRRDAIEAALADAYRRGEESMRGRAAGVANATARVMGEHTIGRVIQRNILSLPPRSPNEQETET